MTEGCSKLQQYAAAGYFPSCSRGRRGVRWCGLFRVGTCTEKGKQNAPAGTEILETSYNHERWLHVQRILFLYLQRAILLCPKTDAASIGHALVRGHANQWIPLATAPSISIKTRATDASQPCVALMPDVYGAHTSRQTADELLFISTPKSAHSTEGSLTLTASYAC